VRYPFRTREPRSRPEGARCCPAVRSPSAGRFAALLALLAVAFTVGGCSLKDDEPASQGDGAAIDARTVTGTRTVERTKVDVVGNIGREGTFDPQAIYERLSPGVVTVISTFGARGTPGGGEGGLGSGFVLDGDGYVATNAHVVLGQPPKFERSRNVYVEFADGNRVEAKIVGTDLNADVGLLKIDPEGLTLTPLRLGSARNLHVGAPVAAIGSPFGEEQSLSIGVISALDRDIESLTQFRIGDAIQTDAAINRGNSGGPLLDAQGRVLGINSQIKSSSGGGEGVGFAVPVDTVRRSVDSLRESGRVEYGYLGVSAQPLYPQLARRLGLPVDRGALVARVEKGSPAAKAGVSAGRGKIEFQGQPDIPTGGDVIVAVDGQALGQAIGLPDLIGQKRPGQKVRLELVRGNKRRTVEVTLAPRPATSPRP
jgi:S1-C subfamily serine protease